MEFLDQIYLKDVFVSVVVATYNDAQRVARLVESLEEQTFPRDMYEIIVVDNNSADDTARVLQQYNVRYILETKQGPSAARNAGIRAATGSIVAFTDSDCVADKFWLEELIFELQFSGADACGGDIVALSEKTFIEQYCARKMWSVDKMRFPNLYGFPYPITANVAYRKEVLDRIGGFRGDIPVAACEDTALWYESRKTGARLTFTKKAIIYHEHRKDMRGLYWMGRKSGYGFEKFAEIYPEITGDDRFIKGIWRNLVNHNIERKRARGRSRLQAEADFCLWCGNFIGRLRAKLDLAP